LKQSTNDKSIRLENVLHVPDISVNLLSVAKITDHGYNVKFDKDRAIVYRKEDDSKLTVVYVKRILIT